MTTYRPAWFLALLLTACTGSGTEPPPVDLPIIAVGVARLDRSPDRNLGGYLAFFFDADNNRLLTAEVEVTQVTRNIRSTLDQTIEPGVVEGPIYFLGRHVQANETYRLAATIHSLEGDIQVSSPVITAPAVFEMRVPAVHPANQPLVVTWDPVPNAQAFRIEVTQTGFMDDVQAGATSFTIPASAFAGLRPGDTTEIEVTAYNSFYVSLSEIGNLQDAEAAVLRFSKAENITGGGARGSFGVATSVGSIITIQ
jgi:hypothetical protein